MSFNFLRILATFTVKVLSSIKLSSSADDDMNIVMAMDMGGDDFISKPFALSVLTAKINALLRRSYSFTGQMNLLEHKGLRLNLADAEIFYGEKLRNRFVIFHNQNFIIRHRTLPICRKNLILHIPFIFSSSVFIIISLFLMLCHNRIKYFDA